MNRLPLLIAILGCTFLLAGCPSKTEPKEGEAGPATKVEPPKDGLKELIKEDIVVGKPTRFSPKARPVEKGDTLWVIYTGRFKDGKVFDTNDPKQKEGAKLFSFTVGVGQVIAGWDEGFIGMLPGGERKLSVPFAKGYNDRELPNIPKYSDLYFDVKLIDYVKFDEMLTYGMFDKKVGSGKAVVKDSKVTVHTIITDCAGNMLEDTRKTKPVVFQLGKEETFPVIEDGLLGMRPGGIRELSVPPMIGFRTDPQSGMEAQTLFYVTLELLKVE